MSGLFKPPAQDPVFTLGDEDIGDLDPVVILPHNTGSIKAAALQSASQRSSQSAALPVSSAAGATQGPLNGSSLAAPIVRQDVSTAKGVDATSQAHQIESVPATSSPGPTIMSNAATQIAQDHRTYSEDDLSTPASIHVTEPLRLPQSSEYKHVGSKVHNGSAQPVQGTLPNEDVATDDVRHLNEDEEQRLAKVGNGDAYCLGMTNCRPYRSLSGRCDRHGDLESACQMELHEKGGCSCTMHCFPIQSCQCSARV